MAKTILLADDSVTIQKVVELTFMDQDVEVRPVGNGEEALAELGRGAPPDLVIADVHMPGADGYEVCRRVKEAHPGLPVLLLVGTFEPFDEGQAQTSGADAHLKKPFDSQDLLRLVEELTSRPRPAVSPAEAASQAVGPATQPMADFDVDAQRAARASTAAESASPAPPFDTLPEPPASADATPSESPFEVSPPPMPAAATAAEASPAESTPFGAPPPPEWTSPEPSTASSTEPASTEPASSSPASSPEPPPAETTSPEPSPVDSAPAAADNDAGGLSDEDVDRVARRVVELLGDGALREVAWEVVPDLAEVVIKERIRQLESQVE